MKNNRLAFYAVIISLVLVVILFLSFHFFFPIDLKNENGAVPIMIDERLSSDVVPERLPEFIASSLPSESDVFVDPMAIEASGVAIANPTSANCVAQGGDLHIQSRGDGSQFGLCYFEDNKACEEWALMNGDFPVGGRRTSGYDTEAQKYCAWLGGEVSAAVDVVCSLPDGRRCLAADLYQGYDCSAGTTQN